MNRDSASILRKCISIVALGIAKVHISAWQSAYVGLIPDSVLQNLAVQQRSNDWLKHLETQLPTAYTFIALLGEVIVAFIAIGSYRGEGSVKDHGEIFSLYVDPSFQSQGIGKALMNAGLNLLKEGNFSKVLLWAIDGNMLARAWYESHGWKADGKTRIDQRGNFELCEVRFQLEF